MKPSESCSPAPLPLTWALRLLLSFSTAAGVSAQITTPRIDILISSSIPAGTNGTTLTIGGTGFLNNQAGYYSVVVWNQTHLTTTFLDAKNLSAVVPATLLASPGTASVRVAQCTGSSVIICGPTSNAVTVTITVPNPVITSLSSISAPVCRGDLSLTVTGSGFYSGSVVRWNGAALQTSFVSSTRLTAIVPASLLAVPGAFNVDVAQPTGLVSKSSVFNVIAPSVAGLSPNTVVAGSPAFTLTVSGSNFTSGASVRWNTTTLQTTFVSSTQLTAVVPTNLLSTAGNATVTVVSPCGAVAAGRTFSITAGLAVSGLSPAALPSCSPAFELTVSGTGFAYGSSVLWRGNPLPTTYVSATQLRASVSAALIAAPGLAAVSVTSPVGGGSNSVDFVIQAPAISSVTPGSIPAGSPQLVLTIDGSGFVSGMVVLWNGSPLQSALQSATRLTAVLPANLIAAPGQGLISVLNPCGVRSASFTLTITSATLAITSISPQTATACSGTLNIIVSGTGFYAGSVVRWRGTALQTTFINSTQLSAILPANLLTAPGAFDIDVAQPTGVTSNTSVFNVISPNVAGLLPSTATAGSPSLTLTVSGSNFLIGSVVQWNATALQTAFVSSTQLTAVVPSNLLSAAGTANVTVVGPCGAATAARVFTITAGLAITGLSPGTAPSCGPAFELTVTGAGFVYGSSVLWRGTPLPTTFVSATQLRATVFAALIASPGLAPVSVTSPSGGGSNSVDFVIQAPAISSVTPGLIPAGSPQLTLTIDGSGFVSGMSALWNGAPLQSAFVSATRLTAVLPANLITAPGQALVSLVNPCGVRSDSFALTIGSASLIITSIHPQTATACGGTLNITVNGSGFFSGASVRWANTPLQTTFISSNQLSANVPATLIPDPTTVAVTVALLSGAVSNALPFTLTASTVTSVSPVSTPAGSAALSISVTGSNFTPGLEVRWNGAALQTTFLSPTQLSAVVPSRLVATPGTAAITVVNACGLSIPAAEFTISATPAVLSAISPATVASCGQAFTLTASGSGFLSGAAVRWENTALQTSFISSTQLSAVVGAGLIASPGAVRISVLNPGSMASSTRTLTVTGPAISGISPAGAAAGSAAFSLTVNGTNFVSGLQVRWNGAPLQTSFVSAAQLTASIPANLLASPGTVSITVSTTCGGVSEAVPFTIGTAGNPTIASLSPASNPVCTPAFPLVITGSGFSPATQAFWDATPLRTGYVSPTHLTVDVTPDLLTAAMRVPITVRNPGGEPSGPVFFDVRTPVISSATPNRVQAGASAFTLNVNGTAFAPGMAVLWDSNPLPTTFSNATQLFAAVPASLLASPGTTPISVATSCAGSSNSVTFTITPPPITAVTVSGLPAAANPAQQHQPVVNLADPYPLPLTGEAALSFTAATDLVNLPPNFSQAYQQVQFATGGTRVSFTIPPGSTQVELPMIQTGTVAGRISVSVTSLRQGDVQLPMPGTPARAAEITGAAPRISDVQVTRNATGFELRVAGDSCIREVSEILVTFRGPSGSSLQTFNLTIPAATQFASYFTAATSSQFGGTYLLTAQFTIQGEQNAVNAVAVSLRNRIGTSPEASASF